MEDRTFLATNSDQAAQDYQRIGRALRFIEDNSRHQPTLKEIAGAAALSEYHFQRLFSRWVGISPKRFLQFLTKEYAKQALAKSASLLDAAYDSGLTGPGRLHDLFVACEAVTPGEFKQGGEGVQIEYGFHPTPFGTCLIATTERGICNLAFAEEGEAELLRWLGEQWPKASLSSNQADTGRLASSLFKPHSQRQPFHLALRGTNFQMKVWEALLRVPPGWIVSYQQLAALAGRPRAVRAVASAVANNPIAYLIPCHRVIRKMGVWHNYRWGTARKKALLGWEASHYQQSAQAQPVGRQELAPGSI